MTNRVFQRRQAATAFGLSLALLTAACGGDGSSTSSPPPSPVNHAPSFTSGASVSTVENSLATGYTAAATDSDGDPVTITITGGADAGKFVLTGGALTFVSTPNYDQPADANTDNTYEVTLGAADGKGGATTLALSVAVTNDHEGVNLSRVAGGFGTNAVMTARSRKSGLLVVSQDGSVYLVNADDGTADKRSNVFKAGETGRVLAVADFNFYGVVMLDIVGRGVILRSVPLPESSAQYTLDVDLADGTTAPSQGAMFVGGDGSLFAALGDPASFAQDKTSGYGKLFAVVVDPYCGASTLAYCLSAGQIGVGLHAPAAGGSYQNSTFLLDRGTDQQEEVNYFNQDARPIDFGWPSREGTFERVANAPVVLNGPSLTYGHGTGFFDGQGVTGGAYYPGPIASLAGKVLLTDQSGKIFALPATFLADGVLHRSSEMENRTADFAPTSGTIRAPVAIVRDQAGRLFVLNGDGDLYATS